MCCHAHATQIPDSIPKPDYYTTGVPTFEINSKQQNISPIRTAKEIAGIREACRIARIVQDAAHAAIGVGVMTDEIDIVVRLGFALFAA